MTAPVLITRRIPEAGLRILDDAHLPHDMWPHPRDMTREELAQAVTGRQAVIAMLTNRFDASVFDAAGPALRIVANFAVGYDNIDVPEATRRGIWVTNTPGVLTEATADLAWALLLAAARRLVEGDRLVRSGHWGGWHPLELLGHSVAGRTLGIIGAGRIGTAVARRATGFGMTVLYCDRRASEPIEALGARRTDLPALLRESDFVSIHVDLNPSTRHLIDAASLALMKPTAVLINTSRGPVIDEAALIDALRTRRIAAAGLDVYENEPHVPPDLRNLDNVVLLPHIGSATVEAREAMARMAAENVVAALRGLVPPNAVNPEVAR